MGSNVRYRLLGPVEVEVDGAVVPIGGAKARTLLTILLLNADTVVSTHRLIDGVWGETPPLSAPHALHVYVSRLRAALPDGVLVSRPAGYLAAPQQDELDVAVFVDLYGRARAEAELGASTQAAHLYRQAVELWRGPALGDLADNQALKGEATRLNEMRLLAFEDHLEFELESGNFADAIVELTALSHGHPLRERFRVQLAIALYRAGRQAEALRAIADYRELLRDELGLEPAPEIQQLEHRILQHDNDLLPRDRDSIANESLVADPKSRECPSIAVLPFRNMTRDPTQDYFADGIAEELTLALGRLPRVFVISGASTSRYTDSSVDPRSVRAEFGVDYLLSGTVRSSADRLRLSAMLVDTASAEQLWAERFDRRLGDVFDVQDEIVRSVVGSLAPAMRAAEIEKAMARRPTELGAYQYFLRAIPHVHRMTRNDHDAALRLLQSSISIDAAYAPALAMLAWIHTLSTLR